MGLKVEHIDKSFDQLHVIQDLSMEVKEGSIFGFLGPNGAGKTTTMRMILDILRPDSGSITWNGQHIRDIARNHFGYLPEERGLYPKVEVQEQLLFLARLNGLSKTAAQKNLDEWLDRFDIQQYRHMKVEELCEDVVIIDKGQTIISGSVRDVKRQEGRNVARLKLDNDPDAPWLDTLPGVKVTKRRQDYIEMNIKSHLNPNLIVEEALRHGAIISRFELTEPSLTDIFIEHVGKTLLQDAAPALVAQAGGIR